MAGDEGTEEVCWVGTVRQAPRVYPEGIWTASEKVHLLYDWEQSSLVLDSFCPFSRGHPLQPGQSGGRWVPRAPIGEGVLYNIFGHWWGILLCISRSQAPSAFHLHYISSNLCGVLSINKPIGQ